VLNSACVARLVTSLPLVAGVEAAVDPVAPNEWQSIRGVTGPLGKIEGSGKIGRLWLRMAVIDALDRWLQLPVNGGLLLAERAVARADVAALVDGDPVRAALLGEAEQLIRAARPELEAFLTHLTLPVPAALRRAVVRLMERVVRLAEHAGDLRAVDRIARSRPARTVRRQARVDALPAGERGLPGDQAAGLLDPLLLPARVVRFSDDPALGEIHRIRSEINGVPVLMVEVPAVDHGEGLFARFVDASTGAIHARLLLTCEPGRFTARLPLDDGVDPDRLRVEIVDVAYDRPSGGSDDLIESRRAAVLLRQGRLLASLRLLGVTAEPEAVSADRVRAMTTGAGAPLVAELVYAHEVS
jgi:hypothetical protein